MSRPSGPASTGGSDSLAGLDRRTFIGMALGLLSLPLGARAATSAITSAPSASPSSDIGIAPSAPSAGVAARPAISPGALLGTLSDPAAAGRLGQRYLAEHPRERYVNRLVDQLLLALNAHQGQVPTDRIALQQALTTLIQHEYTTAPLSVVDGWMLAPSEARLYALAALAETSQQVHAPAPLRPTLRLTLRPIRPASRPTASG